MIIQVVVVFVVVVVVVFVVVVVVGTGTHRKCMIVTKKEKKNIMSTCRMNVYD